MSWYLKKAPQNTPKYQISLKSARGFGSYEHLKFRLMRRLKYSLWRHNDVIVVTSQLFCYHYVEYIKFDTCVKFHDHQSSNNKVMMGGPSCPPPPWLTVQKKPMSNRVNIYGWSSGHFIHTSYDIKIIINQRFCPVPQNLLVASVHTRNEINEGEESLEIWQWLILLFIR